MATCRALGRVGVPVIAIDSDLEQPGAQTRYATKIHCPDFQKGGPGLVATLIEIGEELARQGQKGVLLPSGDLNVQIISEEREALDPYFHYRLPEKEVARLFLDKKSFY
ncbi:MAG: hypothetical protein P8R45_05250, partial [Candidatus Binatia bacterium]|nr:hypothetical protein [Candidatus Binatia bacterium]